MDQERNYRHKLFKLFQDAQPSFFEQQKSNDKRYKKFDNYYMLNVCPKGRNGATSDRLYEVFYGYRIYGSMPQTSAGASRAVKTLVETGCTICFNLNDHGYVAVMLFPGKTEFTTQQESVIFIENYLHPRSLSKRSFLKWQWRYLNAYMEVTSLDGKPSVLDRLIVFYLRNFKNKVIDDKYCQKPISIALLDMLKFILNIGLSGFIIYLFTVLPQLSNQGKSSNVRDSVIFWQMENRILKERIRNAEIVDSLHRVILENLNDSARLEKTAIQRNR